MNVFLRIDINIIAIILLGAVLSIAHKRLDKSDKINILFLKTSLIIIIQIFIETMTCIVNRRPEPWFIPLAIVLHILLFTIAPILTYHWYIFIHRWVVPEQFISKKRYLIWFIPVIVNFIITVLSPIYGFVFYINSFNVYQRGELFIVSSAIIYIYLVLSFILILIQKNKIVKYEFLPLFVFGLLPLIGGLLQTLFYGILLMWSSAAFSLVLVYNFLQQRMVNLDNLTGVWTRGSFDYYMSKKIEKDKKQKFGAIFIDLDDLKKINDEYGHFEGDYAIKTAAMLIKSSIRKTDILARFGGDEFVIVLETDSLEVLERTINRINLCFKEFNKGSEKKYILGCSFGGDIFNSEYESIEEFLNHVDNLMYQNKRRKKESNNSVT
jgi:diguanylate cyclase (GGDEF)-like protein